MFSPHALSSQDRYCRLLPPNNDPFDQSVLRALGLSMRSNETPMPFSRRSQPFGAGYTYAGQFVLQDLTRDDSTLLQASDREAGETVNLNQPSLNLSSLYGDGPRSKDDYLYESDHASLKLGAARTKRGVTFDLPLDPGTSRPLLAESRNNDNLILRQIHAMFIKLHNNAVDRLRGEIAHGELFEEASRRVRWQYQWLVRGDYLQRLCNPSVYRDVIMEGNRRIAWPAEGFSIPVEFSHAGARFGHAMVRAKYDLSRDNLDVSLEQIMREVHKSGALDPAFAIDWRRFFTPRQVAGIIDTTIAEPMFELPIEALRRFKVPISHDNPAELPVRTLWRGAAMKLPAGEQLRDALCPESEIADTSAEFPDYKPTKILSDLGFAGRTPLWYYILLEAEVNERGVNLGALGSRLLAEVIEGALRADPTSMISQLERDPKWRPEKWDTPAGESIYIDNLIDLAVVVGLSNGLRV